MENTTQVEKMFYIYVLKKSARATESFINANMA